MLLLLVLLMLHGQVLLVLLGDGRRGRQVGIVEHVEESGGSGRTSGGCCSRRRRRVHRQDGLAEEVGEPRSRRRGSQTQAGHAQQARSRVNRHWIDSQWSGAGPS